ncbi:MAG: hypothetical protein HXS54_15060 [Theionarchaea archaeon]|nr:hypothetical protein [Theionarchaea archaeon]
MKHIDIICVSTDLRELTAIEVKVKDWRTGYRQAVHHKIFAENSYLAVSARYAHRVLGHIDLFENAGIGILEIDGNVKELVKPRFSKDIFPSYRRLIFETLEKRKQVMNPWKTEE